MNDKWFRVSLGGACGLLCAMDAAAFDPASETKEPAPDKVQKIRFKEDDAQNYMVSKVYDLKHLKANDLVPFVLGAVKRYASNSTVDRINYTSTKQMIVVTTGVRMMPYVDDMIAKLDRPSAKRGPFGSLLDGTGIQRYVYTPKFRSSQEIVDLMISTGIPSNATSDRKQDAVVKYDEATNLIYWKDSERKSSDLIKYIGWLDRPLPQVNLTFHVYEIRESTMRDLGVDYLAWKNGPGMDLMAAGFNLTSLKLNEALIQKLLQVAPSAAGAFSYSYGGFFVAPAFDMSFIRLLQQNGKATLASSGSLTITNNEGGSYELAFSPEYQNLVKDGEENDKTFIRSSRPEFAVTVSNPVICFNSVKADKNGLLPFTKEDYSKKFGGNVNFNYLLNSSQVVERNNYGEELTESSTVDSYVTMAVNHEKILTSWTKDSEVEQTIGVPFLCEVSVLKYIFGYTTKNIDRTHFFLTVTAEFVHPDADIAELSGRMTSLTDLVPAKK